MVNYNARHDQSTKGDKNILCSYTIFQHFLHVLDEQCSHQIFGQVYLSACW
jgi:hypothetical protein